MCEFCDGQGRIKVTLASGLWFVGCLHCLAGKSRVKPFRICDAPGTVPDFLVPPIPPPSGPFVAVHPEPPPIVTRPPAVAVGATTTAKRREVREGDTGRLRAPGTSCDAVQTLAASSEDTAR